MGIWGAGQTADTATSSTGGEEWAQFLNTPLEWWQGVKEVRSVPGQILAGFLSPAEVHAITEVLSGPVQDSAPRWALQSAKFLHSLSLGWINHAQEKVGHQAGSLASLGEPTAWKSTNTSIAHKLPTNKNYITKLCAMFPHLCYPWIFIVILQSSHYYPIWQMRKVRLLARLYDFFNVPHLVLDEVGI